MTLSSNRGWSSSRTRCTSSHHCAPAFHVSKHGRFALGGSSCVFARFSSKLTMSVAESTPTHTPFLSTTGAPEIWSRRNKLTASARRSDGRRQATLLVMISVAFCLRSHWWIVFMSASSRDKVKAFELQTAPCILTTENVMPDGFSPDLRVLKPFPRKRPVLEVCDARPGVRPGPPAMRVSEHFCPSSAGTELADALPRSCTSAISGRQERTRT